MTPPRAWAVIGGMLAALRPRPSAGEAVLLLVALLGVACARPAGLPASTRLQLDLVLPDSPDPRWEVTELSIQVAWNSGDAGVVLPFGDAGSVSVTLPAGPADITVDGLGVGGARLWRGLARQVEIPAGAAGGPAHASVFFGKVGAFSSFSALREIPPVAGAVAVPWGEGQILLVGGRLADGGLTNGIWLYDHRTVALSAFGESLDPRAHGLALLSPQPLGNALFLAGGDGPDGGATDAVELFLPGQRGLRLHPLGEPQRFPSGASADPGLELLVGCGEGASLARADLYLPAAALADAGDGYVGAVALGGSCPGGRIDWSPELQADLVGDTPGGLERVDAVSGDSAWGAVLEARSGFFALPVDGGLLQFGGTVRGQPTASYEFHADGGVRGGALLSSPRADFAAIATPGGNLLVVGGRALDGSPLASAEWVDPSGPSAWPAASLAQPRIHPTLADIPGYGAALVFSGEDAAGRPVGGLEIYTYP